MKTLIPFLFFLIVLISCDSQIIDCVGYGTYKDFRESYEQLTKITDLYELELWIESNPDSPHRFFAKHMYEELDWINTFELDNVYEYDRFIERHPNSPYQKIALRQRAIAMDQLNEYEKVLVSQPGSRLLTWHRDFLIIKNAMNENKKQAFIDFLEKYPNSEFADVAIFYRDYVYK